MKRSGPIQSEQPNFKHQKIETDSTGNKINIFSKDDGNTPLHTAAANGNAEIVRALITSGANIQAKNKYGNTPLHLAARYGHPEAAKVLLKFINKDDKTNLEIPESEHSNTPLHTAAANGNAEIVRTLITSGANIQAKNKYGNTPLHLAARYGHPEAAKVLLKFINKDDKTNLEIPESEHSNTPLHTAAANGNAEIVRALITSGVNIQAKNKYGNTPLHLAAYYGHPEAAKVLLEFINKEIDKTSLEIPSNEYSNTPLHTAAANGNAEIVRALITSGVNIQAKNKYGNTPLHLAAYYGHPEAAKVLLEFNADIHALNNLQNTAFHNTLSNGHAEVMRLLITDANKDKPFKELPPIFHTVKNKHYHALAVLLEAKVSLDWQDSDRNTVLHLTALSGDLDLISIMASHATDKNRYFEGSSSCILNANNHTPREILERKRLIEKLRTKREQQIRDDALYPFTNLLLSVSQQEKQKLEEYYKLNITFEPNSTEEVMLRFLKLPHELIWEIMKYKPSVLPYTNQRIETAEGVASVIFSSLLNRAQKGNQENDEIIERNENDSMIQLK